MTLFSPFVNKPENHEIGRHSNGIYHKRHYHMIDAKRYECVEEHYLQ